MNQASPQTLHDIYGPIPTSGLNPVWLYCLYGLASVLIVLCLYWIYRKRQKPAAIINPTAGEAALARIDAAKTLLENRQIGPYLDRLSSILREYIEASFHIQSTRQTTAEIYSYLQSEHGMLHIPLQYHRDLTECLQLCDLAKFAHLPAQYEHAAPIEEALILFIRNTMPPPERHAP